MLFKYRNVNQFFKLFIEKSVKCKFDWLYGF